MKVLNILKKKDRIKRLTYLFISLLLTSIVYNLFLLPTHIVTGGVGGIATITNYVYGINPSIMILLLSLACGVFCMLYKGFNKTLVALVAGIISPLLVQLTSPLNTVIVADSNDIFLIVIFAGAITGIANGLLYKSGYSNGGFPIVSQVLYEKYKISVGLSSLIINMSIVLVGGIFFGSANVMYAIIFLYVNNVVQNKVLLGSNNNKAFYIVTSEEEKVKDYLMNTLHHSTTIFDVKGGMFSKPRKVLLSVIPTKEYFKVKEEIQKIDKNVFFTVTDSYQVKGAK